MMPTSDFFREDQTEEAAEHQAYTLLHRASSFTQCLQQQEIAPCLQAIDHKGSEITLYGKGIYDTRTWHKFLRSQPTEIVPLSLTEQTNPLSEAYTTWLRTTMTRFRCCVTEEQLTWLRQVARLSVVWHIMEYKTAMAVAGVGAPFADKWTQLRMMLYQHRRDCMSDGARLIHHIVNDQSLARQLLTQWSNILTTNFPTLPSLLPDDGETPPGDVADE
jgi:hypothetical protein